MKGKETYSEKQAREAREKKDKSALEAQFVAKLTEDMEDVSAQIEKWSVLGISDLSILDVQIVSYLPDDTLWMTKADPISDLQTVSSKYKGGAFNAPSPLPALRSKLPGLETVVRCPNQGCVDKVKQLKLAKVGEPKEHKIFSPWPFCYTHPEHFDVTHAVMHLNDKCGWSREQIADWLETLDVDLTFPTPDSPDGPE